jgi:DNA polymerase
VTLGDLPAGFQLCAGLGIATLLPEWDVETYSEAGFVWSDEAGKWRCLPGASGKRKGLPVVGAARYSEDPTCEVLSMSYDLKDGRGVRRWKPGEPLPEDFCNHIRRGGLIEAHNTGFEGWINRNVMVPKYGFPPIDPAQMRCSMAKARAWSLPPALGEVGRVLCIDAEKDKDGKRLLTKFSIPRDPTKKDPRLRIRPIDDPEDAERLYAYNDRDVEAEAEVSSLVPDLSPIELEYWFVDQAINRRGIHCDRDGVDACIAVIEQTHARYNAELAALTGGVVQRGSELQKLIGWLAGHRCYTHSLDEESVTGLLASIDDDPEITDVAAVRRALEIRQALGSSSVKKVYAMANQVTRNNRLHDLFTFHGARTGRPTGSGPQPTNLPNSGPRVYQCGHWACGHWYPEDRVVCPQCGTVRAPTAQLMPWNHEAAEDALEAIKTRSVDLVEMLWGDAMATMSGCLRSLFTAAPGHDFICSDYSAIEAVVNACLSGEQWRIDVFNTHGKIYEASASRMFNVPLDDLLAYPSAHGGVSHPLRQKGKVGELALGYLGWIGAIRQMGGYEGTDEEAKEMILAWRAASPAIVYLGGGQYDGFGYNKRPHLYGLEGMAVAAVQNPGYRYPVARLDGTFSGITMMCYDNVLYLECPDSTRIAYHRPRLEPPTESWRGLSISYEGWNTNPKAGMTGWCRMYTYAGKLLENACQMVANRILRHGQVALERAGYPIVQHVYDENCSEVPEGFGSIDEYEAIMNALPPWAAGWPIYARKGWRGKRFRK